MKNGMQELGIIIKEAHLSNWEYSTYFFKRNFPDFKTLYDCYIISTEGTRLYSLSEIIAALLIFSCRGPD